MTGVLQGACARQQPTWFLDAQGVKCALSRAGGSLRDPGAWLYSDSMLSEVA